MHAIITSSKTRFVKVIFSFIAIISIALFFKNDIIIEVCIRKMKGAVNSDEEKKSFEFVSENVKGRKVQVFDAYGSQIRIVLKKNDSIDPDLSRAHKVLIIYPNNRVYQKELICGRNVRILLRN